MAKDSDPLAGVFETKESGGILAGLLAEESDFDRRMMWRLGSWGAAAVGAVVVAVLANQAQLGWRRDQVASADMARQAERLQLLTKESQNEARRLASAIETLNTDRDRLYSRVTVLEQGLDSMTGAIAKQAAAPAKPDSQTTAAPQPPAPQISTPSVAPVASTPTQSGDKPRANAARDLAAKDPAAKDQAAKEQTTKDQAGKDQPAKDQAAKDPAPLPPQSAAAASLVPSPAAPTGLPTIPLVASKSIMAPPDPAASKLVQPDKPEKPQADAMPLAEVAAASPPKEAEAADEEAAPPAITVQQTHFAVDLGSANSIDGLRAMWRGLIKSNPELATLRPIIVIKEGKTGLGMQLRLAAGPLLNAAAAAKYCAALIENKRACDTTIFDGQRLAMKGQDASPQAETTPAGSAKPDANSNARAESKPEAKTERSRRSSKRTKREEPAPSAPAPAPAKPETSSTLSSFFRRQ
jgi:hypothetical protein